METVKVGSNIIKCSDSIVRKANELNQYTRLLAKEVAELENKVIFSSADIVSRDLDGEFMDMNKTVEIEIPAISTAIEFHDGDTIVPTDYKKGKRTIEMDTIFTVDHEFSIDELTQALEKGYSKVIRSMTLGLRQKIDTYFANIIKNRAPNFVGTSGTTPDDIEDIAYSERALNLNNAPDTDRALVIDSYAKGELIQLDSFKNFSACGSTAGLIEASLGKRYGFNMFSTNNVPLHTAGTFLQETATFTGTCALASNGKLDDSMPYSTMVITPSAGGLGLTVLEGDLMSFEDNGGTIRYAVVAENTTAHAGTGVATVKIVPALTVAVTAKTITFPDHTTGGSVRNLIVQKDGIVLVARPLNPYPDKTSFSIKTTEGIPLRLSFGSSLTTKRTMVSLDCLVKGQAIRTECLGSLLG